MMRQLLLLASSFLVLIPLVVIDATGADPICEDLIDYTYSEIYANDTIVRANSPCTCFADPFSSYQAYSVNCIFDYCQKCSEDLCIVKHDAYVYDAAILQNEESLASDALSSVFFRHYFGQIIEQVDLYEYTELSVGSTSTGCAVEVTNDLGESTTICACHYQDCDNDGSRDRHFSYRCPGYDDTTGTKTDVVFGLCDESQDTHVPSNFPRNWPLVALDPVRYDFAFCFDVDNADLLSGDVVAGLGSGAASQTENLNGGNATRALMLQDMVEEQGGTDTDEVESILEEYIADEGAQ
ncbi:expressed unknown protein [Seminavis robusta]|uniref:Uncharacterized protein n=1 Tax=Seminavis robusta TaxID=568900 RepID=A0A9N8E0F3_9STRA|nr:expressed unknown protein [Seminavis robusta]|eukprot:Sro522_g159540.1 n/a (296) ;mRNA; f:13497-14384